MKIGNKIVWTIGRSGDVGCAAVRGHMTLEEIRSAEDKEKLNDGEPFKIKSVKQTYARFIPYPGERGGYLSDDKYRGAKGSFPITEIYPEEGIEQ